LIRNKCKKGIMIWAAINAEGKLLYHIFDENVTGSSYKNHLKSKLPGMDMRRHWFIQDGAGAHYSKIVINMHKKRYPRRWIGRGSMMQALPPRSPDLTPCDFFLWGQLKNCLVMYNANTLDELKEINEKEIKGIKEKLIIRACQLEMVWKNVYREVENR